MQSINETATTSTMLLNILNVLIGRNMKATMRRNCLKIRFIIRDSANTLKRFVSYLTHGGRRRKVKNGIHVMPIHLSFSGNPESSPVLNVRETEKLLAERGANSVVQDVKVVGTQDRGERSNVYNLSVEGEHEYFANDCLVSNCHTMVYYYIALQRLRGEASFITSTPEVKQVVIPTADGFEMRSLEEILDD